MCVPIVNISPSNRACPLAVCLCEVKTKANARMIYGIPINFFSPAMHSLFYWWHALLFILLFNIVYSKSLIYSSKFLLLTLMRQFRSLVCCVCVCVFTFHNKQHSTALQFLILRFFLLRLFNKLMPTDNIVYTNTKWKLEMPFFPLHAMMMPDLGAMMLLQLNFSRSRSFRLKTQKKLCHIYSATCHRIALKLTEWHTRQPTFRAEPDGIVQSYKMPYLWGKEGSFKEIKTFI